MDCADAAQSHHDCGPQQLPDTLYPLARHEVKLEARSMLENCLQAESLRQQADQAAATQLLSGMLPGTPVVAAAPAGEQRTPWPPADRALSASRDALYMAPCGRSASPAHLSVSGGGARRRQLLLASIDAGGRQGEWPGTTAVHVQELTGRLGRSYTQIWGVCIDVCFLSVGGSLRDTGELRGQDAVPAGC